MSTRTRNRIALAVSTVAFLVLAACNQNTRLTGKPLPDARVRPVEHYGVRLDEQATPQQTVFVLLSALRDDITAKTPEARERALRVQFDLCAARSLAEKRSSVFSRPERLYQIVSMWAPVVSHYVKDFNLSMDEATARMAVQQPSAGAKAERELCDVRLPLEDPVDPRGAVYLLVRLIHETPEEGEVPAGARLWRVYSLSFVRGLRPPGSAGPSGQASAQASR